MTNTEICPICKNPKSIGSSGSLTQWIVACTCDIDSSPPDSDFEEISVKLCKNCGKRVDEGRAGSFTQFIFRSDVCSCENPKISEVTTYKEKSKPEPQIQEEEYEELEYQINDFPYDRYKPIEELSGGASGAVFLAIDKLLLKKVVVKMLTQIQKEQVIAFQQEAKVTSRLEHHNIVKVIDFGISNTEVPYMVLEYVSGISLENLLKEKTSLSWEFCQDLFVKIIEGTSHANKQGIFHRDIKPSNILVIEKSNNETEAKIIDFGIAKVKVIDSTSNDSTVKGLVGTPLYMSPEAGEGQGYDTRSEIYSIGCVLYECLTGVPPFEGETPMITLSMHKNAEIPKVALSLGDKPVSQIQNLLNRSLAKDPSNRFQSLEEFAEAIKQIESEEPITKGSPLDRDPADKLFQFNNYLFLIILVAIPVIGFGVYSFVSHKNKSKQIKKIEIAKSSNVDTSYIGDKQGVKFLNSVPVNKAIWRTTHGILKGHNLTDNDLKELNSYKDITRVKIMPPCEITGKGLKDLDEGTINRLTMISIDSANFNEQGIHNLRRLKNLHAIRIISSQNLTEKSIRELAEMKHITQLGLKSIKPLPPNAVSILAKANHLKILDISGSQPLTNEDIELLVTAKNLNSLQLRHTGFDDSVVPILLKSNFHVIDIAGTKVTRAGFLKLANLKSLKLLKFTLDEKNISEKDLAIFKNLKPKCQFEIYDEYEYKITPDEK